MTPTYTHRASARRLLATTAILLVLGMGSAHAVDIVASTTGAEIPTDGDTVQQGITIDNSGATGAPAVLSTAEDLELTNSGTITSVAGSTEAAIDYDSGDDGDGVTITNNATGVIQALGEATAILLDDDAVIVNNGLIQSIGGESAIEVDKDGDITNNGTIRGAATPQPGENVYVIRIDSGTLENGEDGVIEATGSATALDGSGNSDSNVYALRAGNDDPMTVTNRGIIRANIDVVSVEEGHDEGEVGAVRLHNGSTLYNYGTIEAVGNFITGADTDADASNDGFEIGDMQAIRVDEDGGTVHNYGTGVIRGGKHGIAIDDAASNTTIVNELGGTISGLNGSGVGSDATSGVTTVTNYGTISGTFNDAYDFGDGDGVDIDTEGAVYNYGTIEALGSKGTKPGELNPSTSEGIAFGGGTIVNGTFLNTDALISGADNGILVDDSDGGAAFLATEITNYGTIEGLDGYAIRMVGTWNDTVTNYGTITGTNAVSVELGDGDDTFNMLGGSVTGTVDGGAGSDTLYFDYPADPDALFLINDDLFIGFEITTLSNGYAELGTFTSATSFTNAGLLFGTSTLTTVLFTNDGQIFAGGVDASGNPVSAGTMTVDGDFAQGAGGGFVVGLDGDEASLLSVTGAAALDGELVVGNVGEGFRSDLTFTVLSAAGGVTGTFASLDSALGSAMLTPVVTYDADEVFLSFDRTATTYSSFATPRTSVIAGALDGIEAGGSADADLQALLGYLASLSEDEIVDTMQQMEPDTSDASGFVMQQLMQLFQSGVSGHLGGVRSAWRGGEATTRLAAAGLAGDLTASLIAAPSLRPGASAGVWGRTFGAFGDVDSESGQTNGFSYEGGGLQGGVDFAVGETSTVGVAFGYAHTSFDPDRSGSDGEADSWLLGLYGTTLAGPVDISAQLGLSFNEFESSRRVPGPVLASADYDGMTLGASIEAGYAIEQGDTVIRPVAGLDAARISTDSYTETGAGGYNLRIDENDDYYVRSTLGVQVATVAETGVLGRLVPSADIRWGYDLRQADKGVTAAFAGAPATSFTLASNTQSRSALVANAGLEAFSGEPLRLGLQVSGDLRSDAASYGLGLYLRYDW